VFIVRLTKKGKKVAADVYRKLAMLETRALSEISEEDPCSLHKGLQLLSKAILSTRPCR
jgi:DNA-binding MarR family transcriptional regulator